MADHSTMLVPGLDVPGLDVAGLEAWLRREHPELADGPLRAEVIAGGRSNLTYRVDGARSPLVLRRPPLGHVLSSAHDMRREHRVISALAPTRVPVPGTIDLVDDTARAEVTGTPFFVMERVEGTVLASRSQNAAFDAEALHGLGLGLARILAELHAIDPGTVGLGDFGRGDGFLARQLATWRRQFDASRSRELPDLDRLQERLGERLPESARTTLVHGDYRLDNAIVAADPRGSGLHVAAILDWEMSTIGDPLVDLGMFALYWGIGDSEFTRGTMPSAVDPAAGYPSFAELADTYAVASGIAPPDLRWYRAFASYKLGVIAEGIHFRFQRGETVGEGFDRIGASVGALALDGLEQLDRKAP